MKNKLQKSNLGYIYIVLATLGFSLIPIIAQLGLSPHISASLLLFYRFFVAGLIFTFYHLAHFKSLPKIDKKALPHVIGAGLLYSLQCIQPSMYFLFLVL